MTVAYHAARTSCHRSPWLITISEVRAQTTGYVTGGATFPFAVTLGILEPSLVLSSVVDVKHWCLLSLLDCWPWYLMNLWQPTVKGNTPPLTTDCREHSRVACWKGVSNLWTVVMALMLLYDFRGWSCSGIICQIAESGSIQTGRHGHLL